MHDQRRRLHPNTLLPRSLHKGKLHLPCTMIFRPQPTPPRPHSASHPTIETSPPLRPLLKDTLPTCPADLSNGHRTFHPSKLSNSHNRSIKHYHHPIHSHNRHNRSHNRSHSHSSYHIWPMHKANMYPQSLMVVPSLRGLGPKSIRTRQPLCRAQTQNCKTMLPTGILQSA